MTAPTCPRDYSCTFTLLHPRTVSRTLNPWYQQRAGWIVAAVAILVLGAVLAYLIMTIADHRDQRAHEQAAERERQAQYAHELAIEEQRTMQADMAKGDPDMLKLIRQR